MSLHSLKIRPVALFGKLAAALLFLPLALPAQDPAVGEVAGRASIQLRNASYRSDLGGMDLVLAPTNLIPEIRRVRMETWRTDGLAVTRSPDGGENPVGVRIDFSDGYKNLDLRALGQAAANAAVRAAVDSGSLGTGVAFIDANRAFLGPDGTPAPECFLDDQQHPSTIGNARRAELMRPLLEQLLSE